MHFIDPSRAGKRLCVWLDGEGKCVRIVAVPPQEGPKEYLELTKDGTIIQAGDAVHKGYLTYQELKQMFPLHSQGHTKRTSADASRKSGRLAEKTYTTRWGLTRELYPTWQPLGRGKMRDHPKDFLMLEERRTVMQVMVDDDKETTLRCVSQDCVAYRPGKHK
jgi:hypothetical protein